MHVLQIFHKLRKLLKTDKIATMDMMKEFKKEL